MSRWVYGPVASRRFGSSLGVDLAPYKVCSYDCIYCQVGPTTDLTADLRHFGDVEEILAQVAEALASGPRPDVITLAGSGEPTLYDDLGRLVAELKGRFGLPVVILTNGGLLWRPEVADAVAGADVLAPSLDAADEETFRALNRPAHGIDFERMVSGIRKACADFRGTVRLEVMLVRGANDSEGHLARLADLIRDIRADVVDVNTVVRPSARTARNLACGMDVLRRAAALFGPRAFIVPTERDLEERVQRSVRPEEVERLILDFVRRRPATARELAQALALDPGDVAMALGRLEDAGALQVEHRAGKRFVRAR